jgi:hypothetical protein
MPFQPIDTTGYATEETFAPIPVGDYLFLVSDAKLGESKTTGEEYLSFKLTIVEGPKAKRVIYHNVWCYGQDIELNKKRLDWFKSMVKAGGIVNLTDPAQLNGKIVKASVSHYTQKDGTVKDSVTPWSFKEPSSAPLAPPTFQAVQVGSSASSAPAPSWKQATAPSVPSQPLMGADGLPMHDDDIPY